VGGSFGPQEAVGSPNSNNEIHFGGANTILLGVNSKCIVGYIVVNSNKRKGMHSQRQRWRPIHARLASACERVAARPTYLARARSAPRLPRRARPRTGTRTGMKAPGDDCVAVSCGARSVHAPAAHRPRADGWSLELEPRLCHQIKLLQPAIHSFLDTNRTKQHNESTQTRPLQHNRGYRANSSSKLSLDEITLANLWD
jgi:hypothetical protein